jgi:hypothetical protein
MRSDPGLLRFARFGLDGGTHLHGRIRTEDILTLTHRGTLLAAILVTSTSAAAVSTALTAPALILSDNAGNSVTIDSTGTAACTGYCATSTAAVASAGGITWAGTLGPFTIATVAGQSKPALTPAQLNLVLRASTGAFGAGAGNATLTAKWSDVGFAGVWPQTHLHASFSTNGAVSLTFAGYIDNSNTLFGSGTPAGTIGPSTSSSSATVTGPGPTSAPFSMTESVTATLGADSSFTLSAFNLMTVPPPLTLACPSASGQVGVAYDSHLVAGGGMPPYSYSIVGAVPSGLSLNPSTGEISGTPTSPGAFPFTAKSMDTSGDPTQNTIQSLCTVTITTPPAPLTLACPSPTDAVGVPFSSALVATGGNPPYSFFITSGSLPPGLNLNASTGAITGTDTTAAGSFPFTARVIDSSGNSAANSAMRNCMIVAAAAAPPPPACKLWYTTDDAKSFTIHWVLPDTATNAVLEEFVPEDFVPKGAKGGTWANLKTQGTQNVTPATGRQYALTYMLNGAKKSCERLDIRLPACRIWPRKISGNRFELRWVTWAPIKTA